MCVPFLNKSIIRPEHVIYPSFIHAVQIGTLVKKTAVDGLPLFGYVFDTLQDDVVDMIIIQGIVDGLAVAAVFDQLGVFEETKLMRDGGLVHLQEFADLGHASFLFKETIEDADPGGIREILE